MTPDTCRAVFDCNIFLQALIAEEGPAAGCIALVDARRVTLVLSPETLAEAVDVLNRPHLRRRFHMLTDQRVSEFLQHAQAVAVMVADVPQMASRQRDPKDEPYLNLALTAGAKYLVTWDKDLLSLMQDGPDAVDFKCRFPNLHIVTPVAFLREFAAEGGP
jgi:uncharacterized protein